MNIKYIHGRNPTMYFNNFKDNADLASNSDVIETHGPDRRKFPRKSCLISAHYNVKNRLYSGFILDLNQSGASVKTDGEFPLLEKILIQFIEPFSGRSNLIDGHIAWSNDAAFGVKFYRHL
jgi:hypothetical protein